MRATLADQWWEQSGIFLIGLASQRRWGGYFILVIDACSSTQGGTLHHGQCVKQQDHDGAAWANVGIPWHSLWCHWSLNHVLCTRDKSLFWACDTCCDWWGCGQWCLLLVVWWWWWCPLLVQWWYSSSTQSHTSSLHSGPGHLRIRSASNWLRKAYCPGQLRWVVQRRATVRPTQKPATPARYAHKVGFCVLYAWTTLWDAPGMVLYLTKCTC